MILREPDGSLPHYNSLVKHGIRFQMVRTLCDVENNLKIPLLLLKISHICGMNMLQEHYIPEIYVG